MSVTDFLNNFILAQWPSGKWNLNNLDQAKRYIIKTELSRALFVARQENDDDGRWELSHAIAYLNYLSTKEKTKSVKTIGSPNKLIKF